MPITGPETGSCLSKQGDAASRGKALNGAREALGRYACLHGTMPNAFQRNPGIACRGLQTAVVAMGLDGEAEVRTGLEPNR